MTGPLRHAPYRRIWVAALVSNLGTWMHEAAGAWLMTTLAPSPFTVALMQTAATLPFFLLAFPAGALADVVDRRRLLLATQTWMALAAAALGALTLSGRTTPPLLLGLTFTLGIGAAVTAPAWQSMTPELVPRADLAAAVALNAVAFNLARAVGPAAGGLTTASVGPGVVFLVNAVSFLAVLVTLVRWRRPAVPTFEVPEDVFGAMRAGARYVRHSLPLRAVLARSAVFVVFASAVWSLLPLVARQLLGLGAVGYGVLLGCLGLGAVLGATVLPRLRERFLVDRLMAAATLLFAVASATLGAVHAPIPAGVVLVGAGMAWLAVMSSINVAAQTAVSGWVRARALAVSLLVIQGSMAGGALLWGGLADRIGVPNVLLLAAGGLVGGLAVVSRFPLAASEGLDLSPAEPIPAPALAGNLAPNDGPVLVTVEYRIDPARAEEFVEAIRRMARIRRRDGAQLWGVFRDAVDPARWLETFTVESWAEHLRQHERVTVSDRELQAVARSFHVGPTRPAVTHYIAAPPREE
jgi:MFS family permease